jgi:phosphoribosylanthranilate isomerase
MPVAIKICCIASLGEAQLAQAAGAAAIGLVSAMPSGPGVIEDGLIAQISDAMRVTPLRRFLLTSQTLALGIAAQHAAAGTTTLQLVDALVTTELQTLRRLCPAVEVVQVIHVNDESSVDEAVQVAPWVDAVLLDSGQPQAAVKALGGTGRTHNWALSRRIRDALLALPRPVPLWLAGGLRADNVALAIRTVRPFGVDVCSGVRTAGRLDGHKLRAFVAAVQGA